MKKVNMVLLDQAKKKDLCLNPELDTTRNCFDEETKCSLPTNTIEHMLDDGDRIGLPCHDQRS